MLRRSVFFKFLVLLLVFGLCAVCFSLVSSRRGTGSRSDPLNPPVTSGGDSDPGGSGPEQTSGSDSDDPGGPEPEIDYPTFSVLAFSKEDFSIGGRYNSAYQRALIDYYVLDADPSADYVVDYSIDLPFFTNNNGYVFEIRYLVNDCPADQPTSSVMQTIPTFSDLHNTLTGRFKVPSTADGEFEISFFCYSCPSLDEAMSSKQSMIDLTDQYIHFSVYKEAAS